MIDHIDKGVKVSKKGGQKDVQRGNSSKNKRDNQNRFGLILNIGNLILIVIEIIRFILDYIICGGGNPPLFKIRDYTLTYT
jgi:hypothetical protein